MCLRKLQCPAVSFFFFYPLAVCDGQSVHVTKDEEPRMQNWLYLMHWESALNQWA